MLPTGPQWQMQLVGFGLYPFGVKHKVKVNHIEHIQDELVVGNGHIKFTFSNICV